jgi:hypothetical protein
MNSIPNNTFPSSDDTDDPPLSLRFHQELQYEPISFDDLQSDDFLFDFGDFGANAHTFPPYQVPPPGGLLSRDMRPFPHITSPIAPPLPQPGILEPTFNASDGAYALLSQPSASHHAGPSSTAFDDGEQQQASFSGIQNIPVPTPAVAPASAPASSTSSVNWMNPVPPVAPTFGWSTGAPTTPVVRTWDAMAASMGATTAAATTSASATAEPRQAPLPFWSPGSRYPLVRVDDTIEWVRPDVMKMVVYFNFSLNAEDEAHDSWEPRI